VRVGVGGRGAGGGGGRAGEAEAAAGLALLQALADYEKLQGPDAAARGRLRTGLFDGRLGMITLVAEVDGKVAGYAVAYEMYSTFEGLPKMFLEDIFVVAASDGPGMSLTGFFWLEAGRTTLSPLSGVRRPTQLLVRPQEAVGGFAAQVFVVASACGEPRTRRAMVPRVAREDV